MTRLELDRGAADRAHRVAPGDEVTLSLPETPTSGYRWALDAYDPQVLRLNGDDFVPAIERTLGGGGVRTFRFLAVAAGTTPVRLARRRAWAAAAGGEWLEVTIEVTQPGATP